MAESLCCALETVTTLFIGYTPIKNKKIKIKMNKIKKKKEEKIRTRRYTNGRPCEDTGRRQPSLSQGEKT